MIYLALVFTAHGADLWAVHREPELQEAKAGVRKELSQLNKGLTVQAEKKVAVFVTCRCVKEPVMIIYSYALCSVKDINVTTDEVSARVRNGGNHVCAKRCPEDLEVAILSDAP